MRDQEKQIIMGAIVKATKDPYHYVIPVRSVVRQLCYRRNRINELEATRKIDGKEGAKHN